jgi:hypothetical protein
MGTSAIAVIIVKEKHIVDAFRRARATNEAAAVTPAAIGVSERLAFRRLRRHAVLREADSGTFYLDEPSWQALRTWRQRVVLAALLVALVAAALTWLRAW